jgi:multicomponent Na+:H+ antiporter subunit D
MGAGTVLYATGKSKLNELGGLFQTMPSIFYLYMIGALSIAGFPLFSGFISKSITVTAAAEKHLTIVWLLLSLSSTGTFLSVALKLPYFTFFGKESQIKGGEVPKNMIGAMILASFICIVIGIYPGLLYRLLPYEIDYQPYTIEHIIWSIEIFSAATLGFIFFLKQLESKTSYIVLDTDWFYRKGSIVILNLLNRSIDDIHRFIKEVFYEKILTDLIWFSKNPLSAAKILFNSILMIFSPAERKALLKRQIRAESAKYPTDIVKRWPIGSTVTWVTLLLLFYLFLYYL